MTRFRSLLLLLLTSSGTLQISFALQDVVVVSTDKLEYRPGESISFILRNNSRTAIVLPSQAPWQIRNAASGKLVAVGVPSRQGSISVGVADSRYWQWNQISLDGRTPVEPGNYVVDVKVENGTISDSFRIRTARKGLSSAARVGEGAAIGLGVAASLAAPTQPWLGLAEVGFFALAWGLDRYATDPPQEDYTRPIEPQTIRFTLPQAETNLQKTIRDLLEATARVLEVLVPLTDSIELFELAEIDGELGQAAMEMHRKEITQFSSLLAERLTAYVPVLDEFLSELRNSRMPLTVSSLDIAKFQDQVSKEGLPSIGRFNERELLSQFLLTESDIENFVNKIFSLRYKGDLDFLVEYAALRSQVVKMATEVKALPQDFR